MKKGMVSIGILLSVLFVFTACTTAPPLMKTTALESAPTLAGSDTPLLVEADWLKGHMNSTKIRIIDFGRKVEGYNAGHIPDAVFVDRKIAWDQVSGISGMLPSVDSMVKNLEKAGVGNDLTVVIYDDVGGLWASRLFWALEYLGHTDVHILNGGLNQWVQKGLPVQIAAPAVVRGDFNPRIQAHRLAKKAWILENLNHSGVQIVDSRSPNEYVGKDMRSAHGGHIPGANNLNWIDHLAEGNPKTFLSEAMLADIYESQEISVEKTVVTYCQTGVRGAHAYFVLRSLGYPNVRVYDGSWAEWGNDEDSPKATGPERVSN